LSNLSILILEDVEGDAKLIERALRDGGIEFSAQRVETREDFLRALEEQRPDLILADYKLPHFDGRTALKLAGERLPGTPVIIVTGALVDDDAVGMLREGAADYILKDRLSRLAPAVRRALDESLQSQGRLAVEVALRNSEVRFRRLFESALDGILILDGETGFIVDVNPFLANLLGYTRDEMIGKSVADIGAIKDVEAAQRAFTELQKNDYIRYEHLPLSSKTGKRVDVEVISNAYPVDGKRFIQCNIRDIRERLAAQRGLDDQLNELRQFQRVTVDRELRLREREEEIVRLKVDLAQLRKARA
jgi:PAS domain S-box-containing protein